MVDAIRATPAETAEDLAGLEKDEAMTRRALDLLGTGAADAYDAALAALRGTTRHWWEEALVHDPDELEEDQEPYTADAAGLLRFLEGATLPWYAMRRRYEVHLDRKLERMLTILIRLQNLRGAADPG